MHENVEGKNISNEELNIFKAELAKVLGVKKALLIAASDPKTDLLLTI